MKTATPRHLIERSFLLELFVMVHKVVLTFESVMFTLLYSVQGGF